MSWVNWRGTISEEKGVLFEQATTAATAARRQTEKSLENMMRAELLCLWLLC